MWLLISRRIRVWLLVTVLLPVARSLLHRAASFAARKRPNSAMTATLRRADAGADTLMRRGRRRG